MTSILESISGIDYGTYYHFRENAVEWLNVPITILSYSGSALLLALLTAVFAGRSWRAGRRVQALKAVLVFAVTLVVAEGIRPVAAMAPPLDSAATTIRWTDWSFPSLHAALSLAVYLNLALEVPMQRRALRWIAVLAALAISCAVAFAVIYLRVHWVSDVLGGWLIALSVLAIVRHLINRQRGDPAGR